MSRLGVWQNSRLLGLGLVLIIGLTTFVGLLLVINLACSPGVALADGPKIRYVDPGGTDGGNDCAVSSQPCATIQRAVDVADAGDEIRVATGTYTDMHVRSQADIAATDMVTQVVYISKTVTVRGGYTTADWDTSNPISYPTTLDARGQGRVLYITGNISPAVEGLRVTGGYVRASGGGIYNKNADLALVDTVITDNVSDGIDWGDGLGGGMYVETGRAVLTDVHIISNSASYKGGGICVWGNSVTLNGGQVSHNIAKGPTYWDGGGGVWVMDSATLNGVQIISNSASHGGGLYVYFADVMLSEVQILDNSADWAGGGMFTWWERTNVTVNGGEIIGNSAGSGGGVACGGNFTQTGSSIIAHNFARGDGGGLALDGRAKLSGARITHNSAGLNGGGVHFGRSTANATLINSVLDHNQANGRGSGLYIGGGPYQLVHTTIAGNLGGNGSGIHVAGTGSTVSLTNTILVSHTVGITVASGNTATLQATLWGTGTWANLTDWAGEGVIRTEGDLWGDPAFADSDAGDYHIRFGSAAMDAGEDAGVYEDTDGDPRPMGRGYDLGADELPVVEAYLPLVLNGSRP